MALWQADSTLYSIGASEACTSKVSVGDVLRPPVTAKAPALCAVVSFFTKLTEPFLLPFAVLPWIGVHQTSMP
jgi:hypothetical protein